MANARNWRKQVKVGLFLRSTKENAVYSRGFFPRDWSCPAGIDRDASRFQGLDAILDWHT